MVQTEFIKDTASSVFGKLDVHREGLRNEPRRHEVTKKRENRF